MSMLSPTVLAKYAGIRMPVITEAVRWARHTDKHYTDMVAGRFAKVHAEAAYNHYMRHAMIRELTREREYPVDFAADAYEWLSDCEVTRSTKEDMPNWYYALLVDKWYEGGLTAYLADVAAWADWQDNCDHHNQQSWRQ